MRPASDHKPAPPASPPAGDPEKSPRLSTTALAAGFLALLAALLFFAWRWESLTDCWVTLDPHSAAGTCRDGHGGTVLFCDFANHYYPQGMEIFGSARPVFGFFYPAPFAILMGFLALFGRETALAFWLAIVVATTVALYLLPQLDLFARRNRTAVVHSLLFASCLPVLHNFLWGQVSALTSLLVLGALVLYGRGHPKLAAGALAVATAIKVYPAFFALYLVLKRDLKALTVFVVTCLACMLLLPAVVLGIDGSMLFYRELASSLDGLSRYAEGSEYSNHIANSISMLAEGRVQGHSALFLFSRIGGYVLAGVNALLLYLLIKRRVEHEAYWAATLGFTTIPLVVGTSWVHYFVYLPLIQSFLFLMVADGKLPRWTKVFLCAGFLGPSVVFSNVLFFDWFDNADLYYRSSFVFWSSALLMPVGYVQALSRLLEQRPPARECEVADLLGQSS